MPGTIVGLFALRPADGETGLHIHMCQLATDDPSRPRVFVNETSNRIRTLRGNGGELFHHVKIMFAGDFSIAELRHAVLNHLSMAASAIREGTRLISDAASIRDAMDSLSLDATNLERYVLSLRAPFVLGPNDLAIRDAETLDSSDTDTGSESINDNTYNGHESDSSDDVPELASVVTSDESEAITTEDDDDSSSDADTETRIILGDTPPRIDRSYEYSMFPRRSARIADIMQRLSVNVNENENGDNEPPCIVPRTSAHDLL
jgi:hypothetical protein